ncbi:MAG TPA: hypothetical protein PKL63_08585, partial [Dermatophilaceae bacterium]|nr:hypothetical protein [Dermatophilaceae bacterium]
MRAPLSRAPPRSSQALLRERGRSLGADGIVRAAPARSRAWKDLPMDIQRIESNARMSQAVIHGGLVYL